MGLYSSWATDEINESRRDYIDPYTRKDRLKNLRLGEIPGDSKEKIERYHGIKSKKELDDVVQRRQSFLEKVDKEQLPTESYKPSIFDRIVQGAGDLVIGAQKAIPGSSAPAPTYAPLPEVTVPSKSLPVASTAQAKGIPLPDELEGGTQYHPKGALKSTVYDALAGMGTAVEKVPEYIEDMRKRSDKFYDNMPPDLRPYKAPEGEHTIPEKILGGIKEAGKTAKEYYREKKKLSPAVQEYEEAVKSGKESILTEALGSVGPTAVAAGMSLLPGGAPLSFTYFLGLNTEEAEKAALDKGAEPNRAKEIAKVTGTINSLLDQTGISSITRKLPIAKQFTKRLVDILESSFVEGGTEVTQDIVAKVGAEWTVKPEKETSAEFAERMYKNLPELAKDSWKTFKVAALVGGGMRTVGHGYDTLTKAKKGEEQARIVPPEPTELPSTSFVQTTPEETTNIKTREAPLPTDIDKVPPPRLGAKAKAEAMQASSLVPSELEISPAKQFLIKKEQGVTPEELKTESQPKVELSSPIPTEVFPTTESLPASRTLPSPYKNPKNASILAFIEDDIRSGEPGRQTKEGSYKSSYPAYWKGKGNTKTQTLSIINKINEGETLSPGEEAVINDLIEGKRSEMVDPAISDKNVARLQQPIVAAELNEGDQFRIEGEKFEVKKKYDDGTVKIEDGKTYNLDYFDQISVDRGTSGIIKAGEQKPLSEKKTPSTTQEPFALTPDEVVSTPQSKAPEPQAEMFKGSETMQTGAKPLIGEEPAEFFKKPEEGTQATIGESKPEYDDIKVIKKKLPENIEGYFDDKLNTIYISSDLSPARAEEVLRHERTHVKQLHEGTLPTNRYVPFTKSVKLFMDYFTDPEEVLARSTEKGEQIGKIWDEVFKLRKGNEEKSLIVDKIKPIYVERIAPDGNIDYFGEDTSAKLRWNERRLFGKLKTTDPKPINIEEKVIRIAFKNNGNGITAEGQLKEQGIDAFSNAPFTVDIPITNKNINRLREINFRIEQNLPLMLGEPKPEHDTINLNEDTKQEIEKIGTEPTDNISSATGSLVVSESGVRTLADALKRDFKENGRVDLRGQKISSVEDLVDLSQVFRNPKFETFRLIYVDSATGRILAHEGVTSRLSGMTSSIIGPRKKMASISRSYQEGKISDAEITNQYAGAIAENIYDIKDRIVRIKKSNNIDDVKVYLLHNHPSGDPKPSIEDQKVTRSLSDAIPEVEGHIVIDHKKYAFIKPSGVSDIRRMEGSYTPDPLASPSIPHDLLGRKITSGTDIAVLGREIMGADTNDVVILLYRNTKGLVRGIQEIPFSMFKNAKAMTEWVKGQSRSFGAYDVFAYYQGHKTLPKPVDSYIKDGLFTDIVHTSESLRSRILIKENIPSYRDTVKTHATVGHRVFEEEPEYNKSMSPHELDFMAKHIGRMGEEGKRRILTPDDLTPKQPEAKDRKFVQTVLKSEKVEEPVKEGVKTLDQKYLTQPNPENLKKAQDRIDQDGVDEAVNYVMSDTAVSGEKAATFITLMDRFQNEGQYDKTVEIVDEYARQLLESGRFVQMASKLTSAHASASVLTGLKGPVFLHWIQKQIDKANEKYGKVDAIFGRKPLILTKEEKAGILKEKAEIDKMPEIADQTQATLELIDSIAKKVPPSVSEIIDAYRYQNMLSGWQTQERNIGGNIVSTFVARPYDITTKGMIDFVSSTLTGKERQAYIGDVAIYYKTTLNAVPNALNAFLSTWRGRSAFEKPDIGVESKNAFESARIRQIPKPLTVVSRFMEGTDRFFSALMAADQYAVSIKDGVSEEEAYKSAKDLADIYLYRNKLDPKDPNLSLPSKGLASIGQMILEARHQPGIGRPMSWYVPFIRTPINVGIQMIERSPVGAIRTSIDEESAAKLVGGALIVAIGALFAYTGRTTWSPPPDKKEKEMFYATGRKPFSLRIGDTWVPMWYLGPFALAFAIPAAAKHYTEDEKTAVTKGGFEKLLGVAEGLARFVGSQTSTQSIGNFFEIIAGDMDVKDWSKQLGYTVKQLVPLAGLLSNVNKALDPVYRKTTGFAGGLYGTLPGVSKQFPAYTDPSGKESKRQESNIVLPYDLSPVNPEYESEYPSFQAKRRGNYIENKIKGIQGKIDRNEIPSSEGSTEIEKLKEDSGYLPYTALPKRRSSRRKPLRSVAPYPGGE